MRATANVPNPMYDQPIRHVELDTSTLSPDVVRDALARMAWYCAPIFRSGGTFGLSAGTDLHGFLEQGPPIWCGIDAARNYCRLGEHWSIEPAGRAVVIRTHAGRNDYSFTAEFRPERGIVCLDEFADIHAAQRWVLLLSSLTELPKLPTVDLPSVDEIIVLGPGARVGTVRERLSEAKLAVPVSTIKVPAFYDQMVPDYVFASDALSIIGPSQTAQRQRDLVVEAARRGAWIVVYEHIGRCLRFLYPDISSKVLDVVVDLSLDPADVHSGKLATVPHTSNVLTSMILPVCSQLSQKITLVGIGNAQPKGGRLPHADETRQLQNEANIRVAHPMSAYGQSYLDDHIATVNKQLSTIEDKGVKVELPSDSIFRHEADGRNSSLSEPTGSIRLSLYNAIAFADDHPATVSVISSLLYTITGANVWLIGGNQTLNLYLTLTIAVLVMAFTFGYFSLRRRQTRAILALRHDLTARQQEVAAKFDDRLNALESRNDTADTKL